MFGFVNASCISCSFVVGCCCYPRGLGWLDSRDQQLLGQETVGHGRKCQDNFGLIRCFGTAVFRFSVALLIASTWGGVCKRAGHDLQAMTSQPWKQWEYIY
eukprot:2270998-Amphidinium_carterae.1